MDEVANAGMELDLFDDDDKEIENDEKKSKVQKKDEVANASMELDLFDDDAEIEKDEKKSKVQKK